MVTRPAESMMRPLPVAFSVKAPKIDQKRTAKKKNPMVTSPIHATGPVTTTAVSSFSGDRRRSRAALLNISFVAISLRTSLFQLDFHLHALRQPFRAGGHRDLPDGDAGKDFHIFPVVHSRPHFALFQRAVTSHDEDGGA